MPGCQLREYEPAVWDLASTHVSHAISNTLKHLTLSLISESGSESSAWFHWESILVSVILGGFITEYTPGDVFSRGRLLVCTADARCQGQSILRWHVIETVAS